MAKMFHRHCFPAFFWVYFDLENREQGSLLVYTMNKSVAEKRRWICILVIGVLILLAFGCGDRPDPPEASSPAPADRSERVEGQTAAKADTIVVQVASYRSANNAARERRKLIRRGLKAYVERAEIPDQGVWFRLRVGPFFNKSAADSVLRVLKSSAYPDAYEVTVYHAGEIAAVAVPADTQASVPAAEEAKLEEIRLTQVGSCRTPRWSPRGREIAFFASLEEGTGLFAVGTRGGPFLPLVVGRESMRPTPKYAWSPMAEQIAFVALEEIAWGRRQRLVENLWLVSRQGGPARKVTRQERYPYEIQDLSWSLSGEWLAFNANFGGEDAHSDVIQEVRLVDVSSGEMSRVSDSRRNTYWLVGWREEGDLLYLQTYEDMNHSLRFGYEIWAYDPRSEVRQKVLSGPVVRNVRKLVYLAAQNTLVYSRFATDTEGRIYIDALVRLDLSGGQERTIVQAERGERLSFDFALSSAGNVAFIKEGTLWLTDLDGSDPQPLVEQVSEPEWSPDGDDLVYVRDGELYRLKLRQLL
jgi:Tol biopolymer transport system component